MRSIIGAVVFGLGIYGFDIIELEFLRRFDKAVTLRLTSNSIAINRTFSNSVIEQVVYLGASPMLYKQLLNSKLLPVNTRPLYMPRLELLPTKLSI